MENRPRIEVELDPVATAGEAMRAILRPLLEVVQATRGGVLSGMDPECLHDFRVAVRRTRSGLGQIKGVFDRPATARFRSDFSWLGATTGPARDLDVLLLELPAYQAELPSEQAQLAPLVDYLMAQRRGAQVGLNGALQGVRYRSLVSAWQDSLDDPETVCSGKRAGHPAIRVASRSIRRAHERFEQRGSGIGPDSSPTELHRMRIAGKKLRYLLEFFRSLYPRAEVEDSIGRLKRLQDSLGALNDRAVHRGLLDEAAEQMVAEGSVSASTVVSIRRLLEVVELRGRRERRLLVEESVELLPLGLSFL